MRYISDAVKNTAIPWEIPANAHHSSSPPRSALPDGRARIISCCHFSGAVRHPTMLCPCRLHHDFCRTARRSMTEVLLFFLLLLLLPLPLPLLLLSACSWSDRLYPIGIPSRCRQQQQGEREQEEKEEEEEGLGPMGSSVGCPVGMNAPMGHSHRISHGIEHMLYIPWGTSCDTYPTGPIHPHPMRSPLGVAT